MKTQTAVSKRGAASVRGVIAALPLAMFAFLPSCAFAAPPIACVRNLTRAALDVVAGVQADSPEKPGVYLGKAKSRGGACWYADIDGAMNVSYRRSAPVAGDPYTVIPTAGGGWTACPAQVSANGWYVFTVRRGPAGLACKPGGDTTGLEGPGDYE